MMKLEDQCVSLELAQRLQELGVKQDSLFIWGRRKNPLTGDRTSVGEYYDPAIFFGAAEGGLLILYSAFTVAELGEMLPSECSSYNQHFDSGNVMPWTVKYERNSENFYMHSRTEADARAKMLISLIEKNLLEGH